MGKNRHQHFVPKIYQQGFSESIDRGWFIYRLDKNNKTLKPEKISIKDSLVKKKIYSLENVELNIELIIEEALSQLESDMAAVIKKISNCEELTPEDLSIFIDFIMIQRKRSLISLQNLKEQILKVNELFNKLYLIQLSESIDKAKLENKEYIIFGGKNISVKDYPNIEMGKNEIEKYQIETDKNSILENAFTDIDKFHGVLSQRKWFFIINTNKDNIFITSDFPVYCRPPEDNHIHNINSSWGLEETIFFPVTQNIIAICEKLEENTEQNTFSYSYKKEDIDEKFVDDCNKWTAIASDKYIISSKSEILTKSLNFSDLELFYSNLSKIDATNFGSEFINITSRF